MEGKEKGRKEAVETNVVHSGLLDTKNNLIIIIKMFKSTIIILNRKILSWTRN